MSAQSFLDGRVTLHSGDSRDVLAALPDASIDSVVTDPPYALVSIGKRFGKAGAAGVTVPEGGTGAYARASAGFMGQAWDTGETAFAVEFWTQVYRVLKPGGHVVAFGGTRSYHRLACAIEDAGFEIRDQLAWVYGSGFPKSHDVAKGIDKAAGARREVVGVETVRDIRNGHGRGQGDGIHAASRAAPVYMERQITAAATAAARQWQGWGTALKPAWEPIVLARKPLAGTVAETVVRHGTGALNIDGCRIGVGDGGQRTGEASAQARYHERGSTNFAATPGPRGGAAKGRFPANLIHDGSDEVEAAFPDTRSGELLPHHRKSGAGLADTGTFAIRDRTGEAAPVYGDSGSAARFFYSAKADAGDRIGSKHPTVKPVDLMAWLCRLVTPPGGVVLDPFAGSGSTGEAAWREGFSAVLVEREPAYQADIARRMALAVEGPAIRRAQAARVRAVGKPADHGPLFGGGDGVRGGGDRSTATSPIRTDHRAGRNEEVMR